MKITETKNIKCIDIDLLKIYDFLKSEGLTLEESIKMLDHLIKIHQDIVLSDKSYAIDNIVEMVQEILGDDYFDDQFMRCVLEEIAQTDLEWRNLYALVNVLSY